MSLHLSTAAELGRGIATRQYSSVEVTRHFLGRIGGANAALNAFVTVTEERALEDARRADARVARGEGGPLTGVPLAHKDIFCTSGILTSCGSRMLSNFVAPYDATVVERLTPRAWSCSARPTWTSSRWARRTRRAATAR